MDSVETSLFKCISSWLCFCQRLAEAAEDADLYHDYNDTLEVRVDV